MRTEDGTFLLTTNKGFWRIAPDGSRVEQVRDAVAVAKGGTSPVGTFLEIADVGTGDLLGSGHPDDPEALPQYLGIMRSSRRRPGAGTSSRAWAPPTST